MSTTDTPQTAGATVAELPHRMLTVAEVARLAAMSRNGIYIRIRAGELPAVRLGRSIRIRQQDFEAWMQPSTH